MATCLAKLRLCGYSDSNPIVSPIWNNERGTWEGHCVTATTSTGAKIPVSQPVEHVVGRASVRTPDPRFEVSTMAHPIQEKRDNIVFRVAEIWRRSDGGTEYSTGVPFDYEKHGFERIGRIYVDPENARDVRVAKQRQRSECCSEFFGKVCLLAMAGFFTMFVGAVLTGAPAGPGRGRPYPGP